MKRNLDNYSKENGFLQSLQRKINIQNNYLFGLFLISLFYTLYFGGFIILPILIAILFYYVLSPLVRAFKKIFIPPAISAAILVLMSVFLIGLTFYSLSGAAGDWLKKGPTIFSQFNQRLYSPITSVKQPIENINKIKKQIQNITTLPSEKETPSVNLNEPNVIGNLFSQTSQFSAQFGIVIVLLYFLLAYHDFILNKLLKIFPKLQAKKNFLEITQSIEHQIGIYFLVRIIINFILAVVMTFFMYLLKMLDPVLWGGMAGILEFVPYFGVFVGTIIISFVSLASFDNVMHILLVPVVFFCISAIEGAFITPIILGRHMTINPIAIILIVILGGSLWGIIGAFIAVPIIAVIKIIYNNIYKNSTMANLLDK